MEIEFFDVNQGDSIAITWESGDGEELIGIIDCNADNGNPILKKLSSIGYKEIEFVILTHPHTDHFSGILSLIDYCDSNSVLIKNFGITFDTQVTFIFEKHFSFNRQNFLKAFFDRLLQHTKRRSNRVIENFFQVSHTTKDLKLSNNANLIFRGPHAEDVLHLNRRLAKWSNGQIKDEPDINIYSSIIELRFESCSVLFTSDSVIKNFKRLQKFYSTEEAIFFLVQAPHHGSDRNFHKDFWESMRRCDKCKVIFSVGDVQSDKLPKRSVVTEFDSMGYEIYSTNFVYGIAEVFSSLAHEDIPVILEEATELQSKKTHSVDLRFKGDQKFDLKKWLIS